MITGMIFDLDGLLADTERLHRQAYQTALREYGLMVSEEEYAEHWVRFGKGIAEWLDERGSSVDPLLVRARKSICYHQLLTSSLRPMEGAVPLLDALRGRVKLALASSSYRDAVDGVLAGLEVAHFFDVVVSGLDVPRVKPAPDIFLKAASDLGIPPAQCLVVEDAEKGVIAAHRAGMRSIAVPNDYTRHHDFSKATRICKSLTEITAELLRSLENETGAGDKENFSARK